MRLPEADPPQWPADTLALAEASALLGVSRTALRRLVRAGELPAVALGAKDPYRRADVDALLEASRVPAGQMAWARQKKDLVTGRWGW